MAYVFRRPFDYRAPRLWIGTLAAVVPPVTAVNTQVAVIA